MEGDGIPENERRQIEHIRELDLEELEIEEVDEDESDGDDHDGPADASASGEYTYDTSLVALHSYLGDVEDTHNRRAFLDGGAVLTLPLFYLEGVVLFPEATLPLRVTISNYIAGIDRAMRQVDAPYTIGIIRAYKDNHNRIKFSTTGTTAEIRQYRQLEDGSVNVVTRGQQRFRLKRRTWMDAEGALCGEVNVIKEDLPSRAPRDTVGKLVPLRNSLTSRAPLSSSQCDQFLYEEGNGFDTISEGSFERELSSGERRLHRSAMASWYSSDVNDDSISSDDDNRFVAENPEERTPLEKYTRSMHSEYNKEKAGSSSSSPGVGKKDSSYLQRDTNMGRRKYPVGHLHDVPRAFWPSWVYRMYDSYFLARKAADRWRQVVKAPSMDGHVMKPDLLSFQIASKIPVSDSTRQELLDIDGTSYRLRREIELLESFDKLRCKICETLIAKRSDMIVMSSDGPLGAYANPRGFVHEVMTLYKTQGIAVIGPPVKQYSWFPGYAWSIAECVSCGTQLGWYFSATKKKLKPQAFWGIRSSQVMDDTIK